MALSTVATGQSIAHGDVNQMAFMFLRGTGMTEPGKYAIGGNNYVAGGHISSYVVSLSRISVPVSASIDQVDQAIPAGMGALGVNHVSHGGFQVIAASTTGINPSLVAAGNYTIQY